MLETDWYSQIKEAANNLDGVSYVTPLDYNANYSREFGAKIYFKREDLQVVRSYKIRGAFHKMFGLTEVQKSEGVVCASAGNHAQGVALACQKLKIKGTIFMPVPTPGQKINQVKMFGGDQVEIKLIGDSFDNAKIEALEFAETLEKVFIHPFDDQKIIEGQATVGLEILNQSQFPIDYLLTPIGGGGLAAGICALFKTQSPGTKIIGFEPRGACSMSQAIKLGENKTLDHIDNFVDGAAVKRVGDLNFQICKEFISKVHAVDEGKICETILDTYNKEAIVLEPAGALTIAGLDQLRGSIQGKNVVCILSGGNNDITRMEEIKERAMLYSGLKHYFVIRFPQRAGALKEFVAEILGPNDDITHFEYIKKTSREKGSAVVGVVLNESADFEPLLQRMKSKQFFGAYLNENEVLMDVLV